MHLYTNAGQMMKAGVKVAIRSDEAGNVRNLPFFNAGFAAAYGMGKEEAYRSISLTPAEMVEWLIVASGLLEEGKIANLLFAMVINGN